MAKLRTHTLVALLPLSLFAACASGPSSEALDPGTNPSFHWKNLSEEEAARRFKDLNRVLLNLDKAMDAYVEAMSHAGYDKADRIADSLASYLSKTADEQFDGLVAMADQDADPDNRARAVGALGFASKGNLRVGTTRDILTPLLNALHADELAVVNNAVFALGVLADAATPPGAISNILEDPNRPSQMRIGAAWSLLRIQDALHEPTQLQPVWLRLLSHPKSNMEPWILIQALRGLGRLRNPEVAGVPEPFLGHPTALVRQAAAISLGYLGNRDASTALIAALGPAETNANVRLALRKALQALAGNTDRGYDVREWQRVFETRNDG